MGCPTRPALLLCSAVLVVAASCSDIDRYPAAPVPLDTPERISDASLVYDGGNGHAVLTWTAPEASHDATAIVRYEIRYVYDREFDWAAAVSVLDPPAPVEPGRRQEYRFQRPEPGGRLTAAVVAIDDAGKLSQPGNLARLRVPGFRFAGRVVNALTQEPEAGVEVQVTGAAVADVLTTGSDGRFEVADQRPQRITVSIANDPGEPRFFDLVQEVEFTSDVDVTFVVIPHAMLELYPAYSILLLLRQATETGSGNDSVYRKWLTRPVPLYVPEFTNAYGLDYRQAAVDAANRWMELTGIALWELVDQPPSWGVEMAYKTPEEMGIQNGITHHENDADGYPLRSDVDIVDTLQDAQKLSSIMLHELGHTIRIAHLPKGYLMQSGQPLPSDPTGDEVLVVRILHGLLNGTDMSIYGEVSR